MSVLIADAGSTKIEWVVLEEGHVINRLVTSGFNPNYADRHVLLDILQHHLNAYSAVDAVYYYGSGCGSETRQHEVQQHLKAYFKTAKEVYVTHDLMGACHALFGHQPGIACILGTGANACVYNGNKITEKGVSLGYLVGDEGSGCYIGRKLTRAYFYDLMPLELKLQFNEVYQLNISEFIDKVYHRDEVSKYLAGFTKFAGDHQDHPFIKDLVRSCFRDFLDAFVLHFDDAHNLPVSFVGSVACSFRELLQECLSAEGLTIGKVMRSPIDGLIQMYA